jgi:hypothetical protein
VIHAMPATPPPPSTSACVSDIFRPFFRVTIRDSCDRSLSRSGLEDALWLCPEINL